MRFNIFKNTVLLFVLVMISCANLSKSEAGNQNSEVAKQKEVINEVKKDTGIIVGANQTTSYLPLLKGKRVGIVANQTSVIFKKGIDSILLFDPETRETKLEKLVNHNTHLVDSLITLNINIKTVFAPEHGFRGTADAGEHVKDGIDTKTQLPIVSLYGKNKKPSPEQLKNIDIIIFDIQDVGARFYTYISSLHYVMEACAEANIPVIILDRPNPNGHYIDGPILETAHSSFVGMHPIPVVHGMTIGEYAQMINGEKWLTNGIQCELNVISLKNYNHNLSYNLPIYPSPNLPNDKSINLYPSLCFFEGTNVSAGRGTKFPFQIFGSPFLNAELYDFEFTPQPNFGSKYPKHQDKLCFGKNLILTENLNTLNLGWLIEAYNNSKNKDDFFNAFFTKLAGTKKLQQQIETGLGETEIKATWQEGLKIFRKTRAKYLIYK
ncbi:exo-beta-N-acetylmuramidase NamZ family protein [Thalassobellus sediminis]|uniref:exo-beta-N-acetylmuramidase NamZ family protein n=1 Tax=Thalassobellus sediminis TaxID=3367753 RepID=UPI0037958582